MGKREHFDRKYNPPFYLHKVNNYQKAVYERKGHWTEKEKVKYGVFLEIYREKFEDRENPILNKMFRVMSDFIKTRNHNQCRSHHQKMERERFEIDSILESIRSKYHPREYELFFQKYGRHIQALNVETVLNEKGFTPHKNAEKRKRKQQTKDQEVQERNPINPDVKLNDEYDSIIKINQMEVNKEENSQIEAIQKVEQIKLTAEKLLIGNQGAFLVKQDKQITPIVSKQQFIETKKIPSKEEKELKKTGLQYDSDSQHFDEKPEAVFVDIPLEMNLSNQRNLVMENMNMNFVSQFSHGSNLSQYHPSSMQAFGNFNKFGVHLSQGFSFNTDPYGFEQNYNRSMKQLDDKKKWHLNEAGRLCNEMNEHLQQANSCEQMKEAVLNQMTDLRRQLYFPGHFANNQI